MDEPETGRLRGRKIVRSFSMQEALVDGIDDIAATIKRESGLHVDRSKLLSVLCDLLIDAQIQIVPQHVHDPRSLKTELARAIVQQHRTRGATLRSPPG